MADTRRNGRTVIDIVGHRLELRHEILSVGKDSCLFLWRARRMALIAWNLQDVSHLPGVVLAVEDKERGLDKLLHVRRHETQMRGRGESLQTIAGESPRGQVLHVRDVLHPSSVVLGRRPEIGMVEEVSDDGGRPDALQPWRLGSEPLRDAVDVQEGAQAACAPACDHQLRRAPEAEAVKRVLEGGVQVPEAPEVQRRAVDQDRVLLVAAEGRPVAVRHEDAVAVGVEPVPFGVHAPARRARGEVRGGAQVGLRAGEAERLVVAPAAALDADGPPGGVGAAGDEVEPVRRAIQARGLRRRVQKGERGRLERAQRHHRTLPFRRVPVGRRRHRGGTEEEEEEEEAVGGGGWWCVVV
mmetsp:Transcript_33064/g.80349  ORF Transcript_33064/g.80349 Transcript_33064/m.80349 type:complete len:355 (+) Transcript_33064:180-1244(+)